MHVHLFNSLSSFKNFDGFSLYDLIGELTIADAGDNLQILGSKLSSLMKVVIVIKNAFSFKSQANIHAKKSPAGNPERGFCTR